MTHTPKWIGDLNSQYVWYSDGHSDTPKQSTLISQEGKLWPELLLKLKHYLNQYIAPHSLISVSIWEGSHHIENTGGMDSDMIFANVMHTTERN